MEPYISVWDLDVIDAIDPVFTLGDRKKKKHKKVEIILLNFARQAMIFRIIFLFL